MHGQSVLYPGWQQATQATLSGAAPHAKPESASTAQSGPLTECRPPYLTTNPHTGVQGLRVQNASVPLLALAHFADGAWQDITAEPGLAISSATPQLLQAARNGSSWQASP